jgi:TRAP-type mannitol/chloroaromatic compound transport system permease large subunit
MWWRGAAHGRAVLLRRLGLLLFVMLGVAPTGTMLLQVALAAAPFLLCDAVLVVLMVMFPGFVLYLPGLT